MPRISKNLKTLQDRRTVNDQFIQAQVRQINTHERYLNGLKDDLARMMEFDKMLARQIKELSKK